jgi:hypothetical protein
VAGRHQREDYVARLVGSRFLPDGGAFGVAARRTVAMGSAGRPTATGPAGPRSATARPTVVRCARPVVEDNGFENNGLGDYGFGDYSPGSAAGGGAPQRVGPGRGPGVTQHGAAGR